MLLYFEGVKHVKNEKKEKKMKGKGACLIQDLWKKPSRFESLDSMDSSSC